MEVLIMKKLPEAEFEVMKIIWNSPPPVTTRDIMNKLDSTKEWKSQTVLTLLVRLTDRAFIRSEKQGKERLYFPIVSEDEYLAFETKDFMSKFHKNSFASLFSAFYKGRKMDEKDLDELEKWLKERKS